MWFLARCHRWDSLQNQIILLPQTWPKKGALTHPSLPPYPPLAVVGHPPCLRVVFASNFACGTPDPSLVSSSIHCPVHHIQSPAILFAFIQIHLQSISDLHLEKFTPILIAYPPYFSHSVSTNIFTLNVRGFRCHWRPDILSL